MKLNVIFLAILFSSVWVQAESSTDTTLDRLAKVQRFAFGGVYESGHISQGEKDYSEILARVSATDDFQKLLKIGTPPAKCYALVGLHKINKTVYETFASAYRLDQTLVTTMNGCLVSREPMAAILKQIEADSFKSSPKAMLPNSK